MKKFPEIHVHRSSEQGIMVNSYLVETENGVVAVDSPLIRSEGKAFREKLNQIGKTLLAVLITHAHPDHYASLGVFVESLNVPIITVPRVDQVLKEQEAEKHAQWKDVFQDEWVLDWVYPNRLVNHLDKLNFDGVSFQVYDLGPGGDSDANSIWIVQQGDTKVAFVGDLAYQGAHSYMADGHILSWLVNLENMKQVLNDVQTIYIGHGQSGGLELLDKQEEYIYTYCRYVRELAQDKGVLSDEDIQELTNKMEQYLPNASLGFMIGLSANAVAKELING